MGLLIGAHTGSAVLEETVFWVKSGSGSTKDETLVTLPSR